MRLVFLGLALVCFFAWIGAFIVFHVAGLLIHVLLLLALIFLIGHLFSGHRFEAILEGVLLLDWRTQSREIPLFRCGLLSAQGGRFRRWTKGKIRSGVVSSSV